MNPFSVFSRKLLTAISFVKTKSEVPSLPICYSFILPTLSQEPASPSATSEAEEQPRKAQRVQAATRDDGDGPTRSACWEREGSEGTS